MKNIIQKLETLKYGYDAYQYMPIFVDGVHANKSEFYKYKLNCVIKKRTLI